MKTYLFIFILAFSCSARAQEKVLKDFDFIHHDYKFYFFPQGDSDLPPDSDKDSLPIPKPFLVSDKNKLLQLQKNWDAVAEANGVLGCGYDYIIYMAEGDSLLGRLDVNTKCSQVIAYGVGTSFDCKPGDPFKSIVPDASVYDTILRSDTITRSRALYQLITGTKGVFYPEAGHQQWLGYDGRLYFGIRIKDPENNLQGEEEIENEIYSQMKNYRFHIDFYGYSWDEYFGDIYCDEPFVAHLSTNIPQWETFEVTHADHWKWEPWHKSYKYKVFAPWIFTENREVFDQLIKQAIALSKN